MSDLTTNQRTWLLLGEIAKNLNKQNYILNNGVGFSLNKSQQEKIKLYNEKIEAIMRGNPDYNTEV